MTEAIRAAFRKQAAGCRWLESVFTATILETLADTLAHDTQTGSRILDWPGDPLADVLPLRIAGGLHALARSGEDAELSHLYTAMDGDFASVLARVVTDHDDWLVGWLDSPPQTNDVGRSGPLMAGLMIAASRLGLPIELLELGASGGLNLNLDRFGYDLGGTRIGPPDSAIVIAPDWEGAPMSGEWPTIVSRCGVDQNPLEVSDPQLAERLIAYCWPDQQQRLARLEAAIAIAVANPPKVEAGDAGTWIAERLARPQSEGQVRIVFHSVFWQYPPQSTQDSIAASIVAAGARATPDRPLGWLRFEPDPPAISPMQLRLTLWPGGEERHLATCHPHGARVQWFGSTD